MQRRVTVTTSLHYFYIFLTTLTLVRVIYGSMKQWNWVRTFSKTILGCSIVLSALAVIGQTTNIPNRLIDYDTFLAHAADVGRLRNERRLTEEQFIAMSANPGTVIFDARSMINTPNCISRAQST